MVSVGGKERSMDVSGGVEGSGVNYSRIVKRAFVRLAVRVEVGSLGLLYG